MSRIISYDHGPAPYVNKRKEVVVESSALQRFTGTYNSANAEVATFTALENALKFDMGDFQITMLPESETKFFAKDRDLQFDFIIDKA